MHACSFHLDPHMKSVESQTKMFWCIKNQLKIGDICWRCNCTYQIELIRLSNRLHYNFYQIFLINQKSREIAGMHVEKEK